MKLAAKAAKVRAILDELYPDPPIPLDHRDPFTLLVAVVLSAQTTDKRVNLVTPALFDRAGTPAAMARLPVDEIHAFIRTVGFSRPKARYLSGLAKILVEKHGGAVPRTFEELEELPGVGHKSASVVLVQSFGVPAFPVDTHIHRLARRWGLSDGSSVERTEHDLKQLYPEQAWGRLHLQFIYFGREVCPALRHDMTACPICSWAADPVERAASARTAAKSAATKLVPRTQSPPAPAKAPKPARKAARKPPRAPAAVRAAARSRKRA